jgi:hypothetical protein
MTNKEVYEDVKPEGPKPVGRINSEAERSIDMGTEPLEEEVGVVSNEAPGGNKSADPEIGRTKNERSDTEKPIDSEVGVINNESTDTV